MRSTSYWKSKPNSFSKLYQDTLSILSPSFIVSTFLNERTKVLYRMVRHNKKGSLLDLGCGSGVHLAHLAKRFRMVVGVDYSSGMLALAKENLSKVKHRNWKLVKADAAKLPIKNKQFDVITAMGLLDYVRSPQKILRECHRVLKKDGYIVFSLPKKPSIFGLLRTPVGVAIKKHIFDLPPIDNTKDYDGLLKLLHKEGFMPIEVTSIWTAMWMVKAKWII